MHKTCFLCTIQEKYQLRLKVLEEGLKLSSYGSNRPISEGRSLSTGRSRRQSLGGAESTVKLTSNGFLSKRAPSSLVRPSVSSGSTAILKNARQGSGLSDGGPRSFVTGKVNGTVPNKSLDTSPERTGNDEASKGNSDGKLSEMPDVDTKDCVSGVLYDMLQREVISLRKAGHEKDQSLKDKDDAIEVSVIVQSTLHIRDFISCLTLQLVVLQMLAKKVETLTKAMEVEAKKMRREVAAMEKEVASIRVEKEHENRAKRFGSSKGPTSSSQLLPARYL